MRSPAKVGRRQRKWNRPSLLRGYFGGEDSGHTDPILTGRIRREGRFFVTDAGIFRPRFCSMLSALRPDRSDGNVHAYLDWVVPTGFNGVRVFAGDLVSWAGQTATRARERLPFLLDAAASRGLYVLVTAVTDSREGYDLRAHVAAIGDICREHDNTLAEIANEPYHGTQSEAVHDPAFLADLARLLPDRVCYALGTAANDESLEMTGGEFVTVHLDRGRDGWNQVRRVRELENVSAASGKPVFSSEPIGADERMGGSTGAKQRRNDPEFFFALGVLNRIFEVGGLFHSEAGLHAVLPGPVQQACAEAFIAGSRAIPTDERLTFQNTGWASSPIRGADFSRVVRVYTGVVGERAWSVLVGRTGNPALVFDVGWRIVETFPTAWPEVQVLELAYS